MVLIDTSVWIAVMRPGGDDGLRTRVNGMVPGRHGGLVSAVRLELWPGAKGRKEIKRLTDLRELVAELDITPDVWEQAILLAGRGRTAGLTCPFPDFLIFACAIIHGVELLHLDNHFDSLAKL